MKTGTLIILALGSLCIIGCSAQRRLSLIQSGSVKPLLSLPDESAPSRRDTVRRVHRDTLTFTDFEGREVIIMNAVKDDNGDMVAHDVIDAAVVTARFRNVAERHGKVDLEFQITVPASLQNPRWQLRFSPVMYVLDDAVRLDSIMITGSDYRRAQLRGYQHYRRFLDSIITDTTEFVDRWQLELFLQRNMPDLYALKSDTTVISDAGFLSLYGVSQKEAVDHYTNVIAKLRNEKRKIRQGEMFRRYVKSPILTEGIRLDTVIVNPQGDFTYNYVQTIGTRAKLRKVDIVLSGDIYEQDRHVYSMPEGDPLTFYISSLSAFVDPTERYMTKVVERRVEANTACYIDFAQGQSDIDETLGYNAEEIGRIRGNLRSLLENETFDLDSIIISAYASPEGSMRENEALSLRRARSASAYFNRFVKDVKDSIRMNSGVVMSFDGSEEEYLPQEKKQQTDIRFISHSGGENWDMMRSLVHKDDTLPVEWKDTFFRTLENTSDLDSFERSLFHDPLYRYLREKVYPRLRVVKFDFYLHRKGMVKDTVHTTVPDTVYMAGVQAIRDMDYETAVTILRPYNDYNAAVAFCALDYNESALAILKTLDPTPEVNYMLAVIYSRKGKDELAVKHYMHSCAQDPSLVHRGNLDPEISELIKRYDLRKNEDEDDFEF